MTFPAQFEITLRVAYNMCAYLGEVVGGNMVAVAGALAQHNLALLGESPAYGGDEAERLVDGDEKEDAFAVINGLLTLAHVGVHGADQDA